MFQTIIAKVAGTLATDMAGKMLHIAGASPVVPGQQVWTDGKVIYGNTFTGSQSYIPISVGDIAWLIPYQEIQVIDKSLDKVKKLCDTKAGYITYDTKNFNAYVGGHWQKLPAINDYTMLDACYNKDGDLLEIGYTGRPNYRKGYKGKTEALHIFEEKTWSESMPLESDRYRQTNTEKYQVFYDFTDQTDGSPDFIKLVKNGEIEKSIGFQGIMKSLENDLYSHAAAEMGMQNIYKMYESVSTGRSQMTRNKDGGFTCMLSVSCTYIAYCIKFRNFKELTFTDEHDNFISTDSHHFGKIMASWRVLVTENGTEVIDTNYNISGIGKSWGYLWRKSLAQPDSGWPEYYTLQPVGYGGDMDVDEPQTPKGISVWYSRKGHFHAETWDSRNKKWVVFRDEDTGLSKAMPQNGNFSDYDFFGPQWKNEKQDLYNWRLDNGTMLFNEKNYTLTVNGSPFDYWSNTVFDAYPYKKGFLFVVFYMRESKIKLIYWDGESQKEVASCPYIGDYCRAFRVCVFKNMAKIKRLAGVENG